MNTNAIRLRDAICERLLNLTGYKRLLRIYVPQIQPEQLPSIACYIVSETAQPDGDANHGPPAFQNNIVIGISIVRGFEDPVLLDGRVDFDLEAIKTALLTDPTFVSFGETDSDADGEEDGGPLFESVAQIVSRRFFPQSGETYLAEARLEITFMIRELFEPVIPDDYEGMTLTARPIGKGEHTPSVVMHIDEDGS